MANLQLAVKGEYFDSMIRWDKTEEYRLFNDYWKKRLINFKDSGQIGRKYERLIITKGYPKKDIQRRMINPGVLISHTMDGRLKPSLTHTSGLTRWKCSQ